MKRDGILSTDSGSSVPLLTSWRTVCIMMDRGGNQGRKSQFRGWAKWIVSWESCTPAFHGEVQPRWVHSLPCALVKHVFLHRLPSPDCLVQRHMVLWSADFILSMASSMKEGCSHFNLVWPTAPANVYVTMSSMLQPSPKNVYLVYIVCLDPSHGNSGFRVMKGTLIDPFNVVNPARKLALLSHPTQRATEPTDKSNQLLHRRKYLQMHNTWFINPNRGFSDAKTTSCLVVQLSFADHLPSRLSSLPSLQVGKGNMFGNRRWRNPACPNVCLERPPSSFL
jgi:hypothetical protein